MAKEFYKMLEREKKEKIEQADSLLKDYETELYKITQKVFEVQDNLYKHFSNKFTAIDSKLLTKDHEQIQQLTNFLEEKLEKPKYLELIFRAS